MHNASENTTISYINFKPPEFSNSALRKSFDIFESKSPPLLCKNNAAYKPLKQPISGFKDGLFFIHKLCPSKSRTSSFNSSKPSKPMSPIPKLIQFKSVSKYKYKIALRSKTPCCNNTEMVVQKSLVMRPHLPQKPKIFIKSTKNKTNRRKENYSGGEIDDLKGWSSDYYANY